jgi:membrane associated rhomboid family serine protease
VIPLKDDIPTRRTPLLTIAIVAINVIVYFFLERGLWDLGDHGNAAVTDYGAIPVELTEGEEVSGGDQPPSWLTPLTSMFMHGSLLHLGGNMLFLWIFGNNIEDSMGRLTFVAFYLLGGFAALGLHVLSDPDSVVPTVGASGAIAGVLGAYARLYPRARVVTVVFIIIIFTVVTLPALLVLGVWFLLQLLPAFSEPSGAGGGVAYFAHIGGFVFGLLAIKLFANNVHEDYDRAHRLPVY